MCIMEMRPGQRTSTMVQATAHNLSTVDRDLDMLVKIMEARGGVLLEPVQHIADLAGHTYDLALSAFALAVENEHRNPDDHVHDHDHPGEERTLVEQAHHDAELGRRFMTR